MKNFFQTLNQPWIPGINPTWPNTLSLIHIAGCHLLTLEDFCICGSRVKMICNLPLSCGLCQVLVCDYANFIKQVETTLFFFDTFECLWKTGIIFSLECLVELTDKTSGPGVFFIGSLLTILETTLFFFWHFGIFMKVWNYFFPWMFGRNSLIKPLDLDFSL